MPSDLAEALRNLGRERGFVVRATVGALVLLAGFFCILPFFLATHTLGRAVRSAVGLRDERDGLFLSGLAMVAVLAAPGSAVLAASAVVPVAEHYTARGLLTMLACALVLGVVAGPFATVAGHIQRRGHGLGDAIARGLSASITLRPTRTLRRGLLLGGLVAAPSALFIVGGMLESIPVSASALPLIALATSFAVALVGPWTDEDEATLADVRTIAPAKRYWVAPLTAAAALAFAVVLAAAKPSPPHRRFTSIGRTDCVPELVEVGPHGLSVRPRRTSSPFGDDTSVFEGFDVTTRDGGGCGFVDAGPSDVTSGDVCRVARGYTLRMGDVDALIDQAGVRLDDGIGERLSSRLDGWAPWLVLAAFLSLATLWFRSRRGLSYLHALGAQRSADVLRVARGRLELDENARLIGGTPARVEGGATFVSHDGAVRVTLPASANVLGLAADELLLSETTVQLLSPTAIGSTGLRSGATAWPEGAVLVLGDAETVESTLLSTLSRQAVLPVALASIALGLAAVEVLSRT